MDDDVARLSAAGFRDVRVERHPDTARAMVRPRA